MKTFLYKNPFILDRQSLSHKNKYFMQLPTLSKWMLISLFASCNAGTAVEKVDKTPFHGVSQEFKDYWYDGNAEIASYDLIQSRYGEQREGHAVWVFVTEDFSESKQVKLDNPGEAGKDKVSVLKRNAVRKFVTGIYDYALMKSVFTPIEVKKNPYTLKTTFSSQDWCGQSFMQLNWKKNAYQVQQFSYFESEGDASFSLNGAILEDEIPSRIRMEGANFPTGNLKIIPASAFARLQHKNLEGEEAEVSLNDLGTEFELNVLYKDIDRSLSFTFEKGFPHFITKWRERNGSQPETIATLKEHKRLPYWSLHDNDDLPLRDSLGLPR
ncbi:MAG: hypothetical protein R2784_01720 [Saprospiraceae bacterium]